ncbi:MAG: S41 family peptidase [Fibromonadales bacterium]|nr:S41 family peptidase [Fibromonadales bacterium]
MRRFIILLFSLLLAACGELGQPDEQELYYNYLLLKAYFFHPERIKPLSEYEGMKDVDDMYKSLEDYFRGGRYTFYVPPQKADDKIKEIENTKRYYSFGFERVLEDDTLRVTAVYPISPAASAGLKKHDKLLFANGISLTGPEAAMYLNSDSLFANETTFKVLRGEEIFMRKAEVQKPTVYLDSLGGIPLIRVTQFTVRTNNPNGTYAEFKNVLQEIKGAEEAIIDLQGNPGGSVSHCTPMAAELVPYDSELLFDVEHYYDAKRGNVIDTIRYFASDYVESEGIGASIKWTLLINGGSASCAERFAAIVKYNRPETIIFGETSYGKGVGQVYTKTYLGGLAYITCMQSFYPNGKTFHEVGIKPDALSSGPVLPKRSQQELPPPNVEAMEFGMHKFRSFTIFP